MESFYGGKQGASFTIKETFNSVEEMEIAFRGGDTYKKVAYGEHVLITGDELNEEYGNVYRRGYDGAEFVGNFRGPQGTPFKFQGTYDATKTYYNNNKQIDLVYYDSRTFIRIGDADSIVGVLPLDERYWSMFLETKPGTTWYNGGTITGTNYFGEIFPNSGIPYANQNDYYFNTNTTSIYIAMNEGTPDIVMWRYVMTLANEVNTDDTLTVQGAAADAAKVGQEIEALNFSLSNKAESEDLTEHINNNLIHLTEEDREKLNNIDAGELEQHLLTIENLNNIKPDAYTCYYAHDDNVVMNVPSGYENKPFNLVVYKTSETYRVQEYTSEKGKKFIRYCTHDLTDDNMIDDHGFDWGLNGRDLCKDKTYYGCLKDAAGNSFIIYSDTLLEVVDYGTSGYYINSTNVYHLDNATKTYLKYITDDYWHPEQLLVRTFSGNQWFNMLLYYSSQESIGVYNVAYGTASDIINAGTGWSEWQDMGAASGNIYIDSDEESDSIDGDISIGAAKYVGYNNATSGLEATNVQDALDEVSSILGTKPENVSELFSFNKYNGDISTLAVGMYAYHTGSTYTGNGSTASNGGYGGWGKILSIDTTTGYCKIDTRTFFASTSNVTNFWVKAENFDFILTSTEARYISELVSVWGANNGGLDDISDEYAKYKLLGTGYSVSFQASSSRAMLVSANADGKSSVYLIFTKLDGVSYTEISQGLITAPSISGNTVTIGYGSTMKVRCIYI